MKERLHRTQILLEPEQHQALLEIAQQEDRSISEIVRDLIRSELERREQDANRRRERHMAVIRRAHLRYQEAQRKRQGKPIEWDIVDEINRMRDERDEDIL